MWKATAVRAYRPSATKSCGVIWKRIKNSQAPSVGSHSCTRTTLMLAARAARTWWASSLPASPSHGALGNLGALGECSPPSPALLQPSNSDLGLRDARLPRDGSGGSMRRLGYLVRISCARRPAPEFFGETMSVVLVGKPSCCCVTSPETYRSAPSVFKSGILPVELRRLSCRAARRPVVDPPVLEAAGDMAVVMRRRPNGSLLVRGGLLIARGG
eukprot:scaffold72363_cov60-Phaeocystis_antarctica.AAC.4